MTLKSLAAILVSCVGYFSVSARNMEDSLKTEEIIKYFQYKDSIENSLKYENGRILISDGQIILQVPEGFRYLNAEQSRIVLTDIWGNPPQQSEGVLGMIFPIDKGPLDDSSYAFVITYDELGYVKDDDAKEIDYDQLLKDMQKEEVETNKEREKLGYQPIHFVGWAQKPYYDFDKKTLHWAKELKFGDGEFGNTLNYNVRILGRKGVLILNAVGGMSELNLVNEDIAQVIEIPSFADGYAYADFDSKIDKVAAITIGGLVAGKVLAKAGFFAIILKFLAASWKFILFGIVAFWGFFKNLFRRKRKEEEILPVEEESPETLSEPMISESSEKEEER